MTASFVVASWASLEATFSPFTSEVSKAPVAATAAKALRGWTLQDLRTALCAFRARADLESIVGVNGADNPQSLGRREGATVRQKKCLVEKLRLIFGDGLATSRDGERQDLDDPFSGAGYEVQFRRLLPSSGSESLTLTCFG